MYAAYDLKAQQRRLNHFVKQYNNIRPHEALDMKTPADIQEFSTRPFPGKIVNFEYDFKYKILKATKSGVVRWKSYYWVYVSAALKGKHITVEDIGNGIWKVFFRNVFLGFFDEKNLRKKETTSNKNRN